MENELAMKIVGLESEEVSQGISRRLQEGKNPLDILDECRQGMTLVGERFQRGDYFLAELLLSAEIFKNAVEILTPHMEKSRAAGFKGRVVLATLQGDIHDLGKNIFATLLRAYGFEVHDLGVDVPPSAVVEKVREVKPDFVGFSALITTGFSSMRAAVDLLSAEGLRPGFKLMVGGGVTTDTLRNLIGADFQSLDAMEGVFYCRNNAPVRGGEDD